MSVLIGSAFAAIWIAIFVVVYRKTKQDSDRTGNAGLYIMGTVIAITLLLGLAAVLTA